jgi:hypothetical protein
MEPERRQLSRRRRRGSITLMSLCLTTALGIALSSYLALCSRSLESGARLTQQARAHELAQIGLEEALWALNQDAWSASGPDSNIAWTTSGANRQAVLTYPLTGGTGQVALTISNYASSGPAWPTITAAATFTPVAGSAFSVTLQAATGPAPLFSNAIASAGSYVSFIAGGTVDSWNSDPDNNPATPAVPYSFTATNPANYAAVVAGRDNGSHGVVLTQAEVRGYLSTFGQPVSYATSGLPSGKVVGPTTSAEVKVDPLRLGRSAFVPAASTFAVELPSMNGSNFGGVLHAVLALVNTLMGAGPDIDTYRIEGDLILVGTPILGPNVNVTRPLKLVIDGNLTISDAGQITVSGNGSLVLIVAGDVSIGGLGIRNETGDPRKVALFCTGASTTDAVEFTTAEDFCGVVYCENKPIDIRANATFYGALLSQQYVRFSTNATAPVFHYDAALRSARFDVVKTPYILQGLTQL